MQWAMKDAEERGVDYYDTNNQKEIQTRAQMRLRRLLQRMSGESRGFGSLGFALAWGWSFKVMSTKASVCQAEACLLTWERCGGMAAQQALTGTATSTFGLDAREWTKTMRKSAKRTRGVCEQFGRAAIGKGCDPCCIFGMSWKFARPPADGKFPSECEPQSELFCFLVKKEPTFHGEVDVVRDTSSDTEDGESFSGEDEEQNVENFMLCSFAHFACSPFLQAFLHEEEMCKVALTKHFSLDVFFLCRK